MMSKAKGARRGFRSQNYRQTHNLRVLSDQATTQTAYQDTHMHLLQQIVVEQQRTNQLLEMIGQDLRA
jgi:hypothetical protein